MKLKKENPLFVFVTQLSPFYLLLHKKRREKKRIIIRKSLIIIKTKGM